MLYVHRLRARVGRVREDWGGGRPQRLGQRVGGEGKVGELGAQAHVPVGVVLEDEGGGEVAVDDSVGGG